MAHNVSLHLDQGCDGCWSAAFAAAAMAAVPTRADDVAGAIRDCAPIDPDAVCTGYLARCADLAYSGIGADPRQANCPRRGHAAYAAWWRRTDSPEVFRRQSYLCCTELWACQIRQAARLHLGCHHGIPTHAARLAGQPNVSAACERCGLPGADELHVLFKCSCPGRKFVRSRYAPFLAELPQHNCLKGLASHPNQRVSVLFTLECLAA